VAFAEELLRAARVVLPAPSTLERLVASVAAHAVQDLFERIAAGLPGRLRDAIEDLVDVPEGEHRSPLAPLKEPPPAARAKAISAHLARLDLLDGLLGAGADLSAATLRREQAAVAAARRHDAGQCGRRGAPRPDPRGLGCQGPGPVRTPGGLGLRQRGPPRRRPRAARHRLGRPRAAGPELAEPRRRGLRRRRLRGGLGPARGALPGGQGEHRLGGVRQEGRRECHLL
jgi:hypothetical protein